MGLKDKLFGKREVHPLELPEIIQPEDPVNYNSVLDFLIGLSKSDYNKMLKSAEIYRDANTKVAKVIGIKEEPTTAIRTGLTDEETNAQLDQLLHADDDDLAAAIIDDEEPLTPSKPARKGKK